VCGPGFVPASAPASRSGGRGANLKGVSTQQNTPSPSPAAGPGKPGRIAALAALNALEGAALAIGGIYMLAVGLLGRPDSVQQAEMGGITLVALGLIPLLAARGLLLRRSWSRGPALVTQLMAMPVAWTLLRAQGAMIPAGIALAAVAVTALVLLLNPATTNELGIRGQRTTPGA
jgi:hypothetical protein